MLNQTHQNISFCDHNNFPRRWRATYAETHAGGVLRWAPRWRGDHTVAKEWLDLTGPVEIGVAMSFKMLFKQGGSTAQSVATVEGKEQSSGFVLKDGDFGDKYVTSIYR